jgi:hypothetical protein
MASGLLAHESRHALPNLPAYRAPGQGINPVGSLPVSGQILVAQRPMQCLILHDGRRHSPACLLDERTDSRTMPGVSCPVCDADASFLRTVTRPDYETMAPCVRIVDLFAGGGGLSLGMAEAARRVGHGTDVVLAVEQHRDAARVFAQNFPEARVLEADVAGLFDGVVGAAPTATETRLQEQVGSVDVLLAGPPCQGHSDLNNHTRIPYSREAGNRRSRCRRAGTC